MSAIAGWSSLAARRAHNPKVVGSNPTPATNKSLDLARKVKVKKLKGAAEPFFISIGKVVFSSDGRTVTTHHYPSGRSDGV